MFPIDSVEQCLLVLRLVQGVRNLQNRRYLGFAAERIPQSGICPKERTRKCDCMVDGEVCPDPSSLLEFLDFTLFGQTILVASQSTQEVSKVSFAFESESAKSCGFLFQLFRLLTRINASHGLVG